MRKLRKISGILAVAALVIAFASTPSQAGIGWWRPATNYAVAPLSKPLQLPTVTTASEFQPTLCTWLYQSLLSLFSI